MLRSGEVFAGYRIERELGRGGMGAVYLAQHPRLPRRTALKLLNRELFGDKEIRSRFEREADVVARLEHPRIVPIYDRGVEGDQLWISMRYIDGPDAAELDAANLPPARAVRIIAETAQALDYAHRKGVLHRDVKPANILLEHDDGEDRVFLADFGIARLLEESVKLTRTGSFTATLSYAAPEQLSDLPLDHRCDQYSLACTLFRLLTGTVPFAATNPGAAIRGHLYDPPPPVSALRAGLPPALDGVLARAMAKNPAARFDSCTEFATAAQQALLGSGGHPIIAQPVTPTGQPVVAASPYAPTVGSQSVPNGTVSSPNGPYFAPNGTGAPHRPAPPKRKSRTRGCLLVIVAVVFLPILALAGCLALIDRTSGNNSPTVTVPETPPAETTEPSIAPPPTTGASPAAGPTAQQGADALTLTTLFPDMLPPDPDPALSFNAGSGYQSAGCSTYGPDQPPPSTGGDDPGLGNWRTVWSCFGANSKAAYQFLLYPSAADAQAALDALPANTASTVTIDGHTYTNYLLNGSEEYRPRMVTAFAGTGRDVVLMYSAGYLATEAEFLHWWNNAPIG
ncbi:protein kinase [Nocardia sp. NPDC127526]|uniref:serine/threonine-protein kinase n=1 Tax=Nocardia sp. NPDC127526 TaxID=3345393 RepID=UPI00362B0EFA